MKNSILKTMKKYNLSYRVRAVSCGTEFAEITAENIPEFEAIASVFRRMRGVYVDSCFYTLCVRVYGLDDWQALKRFNACKTELIDVFYTSLRSGKSPDDAKRDQFSFCAGRPEYISAYNAIYN
jgi:hypothetical protein